MSRAVAVVLAAGSSSRLGRPKQLLALEGETLVHRAARTALAAGCARTIVVWGAVPLAAAVAGLPVELVENREWVEGIASSIRAAVRTASGQRILFTLADQPFITVDHLRAILASEAVIVATAYEESAGVPAAFAQHLQPELLELRGDQGARKIIEAHRSEAMAIPFAGARFDLDSEDDYRMLLRDADAGRR